MATLFRDGATRVGRPALKITKISEAVCMQERRQRVADGGARPDVGSVAAITERY